MSRFIEILMARARIFLRRLKVHVTDVANFARRLSASGAEARLQTAGATVSYGCVAQVMVIAQKAGVSKLTFLTITGK